MKEEQHNIEDILVKGLYHILRRTVEVNPGDQLAIAQEYKEWIDCISTSDFSKQDILVINRKPFT